MRHFLVSFFLLFASFSFITAQTGDDDDYRKNELQINFVGTILDEDIPDDKFVGGVQVSYVRNIHRFVGIKADISATEKRDRLPFDADLFDPDDPFPFRIPARLKINTYMGGVEIKDNSSKKKVVPFAHALVGIGQVKVRSGCSIGNCNDQQRDFTGFSDTGFSAAFGGGIDVKVHKSIMLRAIQIDYNPIRVNGSTANNIRLGFGLVIK